MTSLEDNRQINRLRHQVDDLKNEIWQLKYDLTQAIDNLERARAYAYDITRL